MTAILIALISIVTHAGPGTALPAGVGADRPVGTWPLHPRPEVVEYFAPPTSPFGSGHRGVDLLGRPGQPVRAAMSGWISFAGRIAGRGVIVVAHGDTRTTYEPVHANLPVGKRVSGGETIGTLTATGSHCFPRACLHWGWLRGETYLDPLSLAGERRVRLLPVDGSEPARQVGTVGAWFRTATWRLR
ncbi:MAG: M23 family metallopeptidase [Nocardioides sp.]